MSLSHLYRDGEGHMDDDEDAAENFLERSPDWDSRMNSTSTGSATGRPRKQPPTECGQSETRMRRGPALEQTVWLARTASCMPELPQDACLLSPLAAASAREPSSSFRQSVALSLTDHE